MLLQGELAKVFHPTLVAGQGHPGDEADQRGVIDIAPREMLTASQEIELVAEIPVPASGEQANDQDQRSGAVGREHETARRRGPSLIQGRCASLPHRRSAVPYAPAVLSMTDRIIGTALLSGR